MVGAPTCRKSKCGWDGNSKNHRTDSLTPLHISPSGSISFTQPEALQKGSLHLGAATSALPTSTAQPRLAGSSARRGAFHDSLSQQFTTRRNDFIASQAVGAAPSASQFTDAMNFMTQPGATPGGGVSSSSAFYNGAHLTRFYSNASVSIITSMLSRVLHELRVQHEVEPLGDTADDGDEDAEPRPEPREAGEEMDMDAADNVAASAAGGMTRSTSNLSNETITGGGGQTATTTTHDATIPQGSRGTRIRLGLMDRRKCQLKGEIRILRLDNGNGGDDSEEPQAGARASVLMRRSRGNPLEWRRVFGQIVRHREIGQFIVRNV